MTGGLWHLEMEKWKNNHRESTEGVVIVSIQDCQIGDGWVSGKRIGRAYK